MSELKKCPFCGGEARIDKGHSRLVEWYAVSCSKCRASQNVCYIKPEKAIEAWNTRADADIRAKAIDEFVEEISLCIFENSICDILITCNHNGSVSDISVEIVDYVIEAIREIAEQMKGGVVDD